MKPRYLLNFPLASILINNEEIEAIVDTGFNGSLMISEEDIEKFNFPKLGTTPYMMADGSFSKGTIYLGEITWLNQKIKVPIIVSESDFPLIGMDLLKYAKTLLIPSQNVLSIEAA